MQRIFSCRLKRACVCAALMVALVASEVPLALAAEAADSGPKLAPIIVTAQKVKENIQIVPISMSVVTSKELQDSGIVRISDFFGLIPNLNVDSSNSLRSTAIVIRGIVSDPNNVDIEPAVGVYVNGVYMDRPTTINAGLFDLERIEVLRGPQGTIFGKNTIGGAINFISNPPTQRHEFDFTADYGSYNNRRLLIIGNTPLVRDVLALRVAFQYQRRDGFLKNLAGPNNDNANNVNGRISLAYTPNDALKVLLRLHGSRDRTHDEANVILVPSPLYAGPPFNSPENVTNNPFDRIIRDKPSPFENRDVDGGSLEAHWKIGPGTLTSLTGFNAFRWSNYQSSDMTVFDIFGTGIDENQHQWSEELRYAYNGSGPLTYVAGVYADQQSEDARAFAHIGVDVFAPFGLPLGSNPYPGEGYIQDHIHDRSYAAFGQADYHFDAHWALTVGYRYTQQEKGIRQYLVGDPTGLFVPTVPPATYTRTDIAPSYDVSLQYLFSQASMLYATFSHGFKAGGFNAFAFGLVQSNGKIAEFNPEYVNNYEVGEKSTFANGRVRLDADVFYMDYRDLQVNSLVQNSSGIIDFVTSNAAKARSEGVELELQARLTSELEASLGYGYTDAIYTSYPGATPTGGNFTGNSLPLSSKNSASLALNYTHPLSSTWNLIGRFEEVYRGSRFSDPNNSPQLVAPAYTVANLRVGVAKSDGSLRVELWARNLLNRNYVNDRSFGSSAFAPGAIFESIGDPRTYGVEFSYRWLGHRVH